MPRSQRCRLCPNPKRPQPLSPTELHVRVRIGPGTIVDHCAGLTTAATGEHLVEQAATQPIGIDKSTQRRLMRRFWQTARGFWGRRGDRRAWPYTAGLAVILLLGLYLSYRMNVWNRDVFNALEKKDPSEVGLQALIYFPLLAASVFCSVAALYCR